MTTAAAIRYFNDFGAALRYWRNRRGVSQLRLAVDAAVSQRHLSFLESGRAQPGRELVLRLGIVLDIPLLFETGGKKRVDFVVVVSCDPQVQRQRVLARPGMTEEKLSMILARQVPDAEKRARADFVIDTGAGLETARSSVREIIATLKAGSRNGNTHA